MKYAKTLRILGIALILSLLLMVIPAAPALAVVYEREITVTLAEDGSDIEITVEGDDWRPSTDSTEWYVDIYMSSQEADIDDYIDTHVTRYELMRTPPVGEIDTDAEGTFTRSFDAPSVLNDGSSSVDVEIGDTYYIYVTHEYTNPASPSKLIEAVHEFILGIPEIELDPEEGTVDSEVEITGSGFAAREDIVVEFDGDEIDIEDGDDETESDGEFTLTVFVPESAAGEYTITVTASTSEAEATFTVEPDVYLTQTSGEVGTSVTADGTGFGSRQDITIYFNNTEVTTAGTSRSGSFAVTFTIPDKAADVYDVTAEDEDENWATTKFTVVAPPTTTPTATATPTATPTATATPTTVTITPESGNVGDVATIIGTGFAPNKAISIKFAGEEIATAATESTGLFAIAIRIPAGKHGKQTITASDGTSTHEFSFTVETGAPQIPAPLLPAIGAKVESPIAFDWGDVTDVSQPVTYDLQVATDRNFTTSSIVLEKKALAKSEYTLTTTDELRLASQETPYYWQVRAVDAAANEGQWTGAGEFYLPAPFGIPDWALYTLAGLGGLLLLGLGYWWGRKTSYYY